MIVPNESDQLLNTVYENVLSSKLSGSSITAGVSGGPDSLAMLDILHKISSKTRLNLSVAHFNHGIRGEESNEDEDDMLDKVQCLNLELMLWVE